MLQLVVRMLLTQLSRSDSMVGERLHGTDGIRGKISTCEQGKNPIENLIFQREFSPELAHIIGLATGYAIFQQFSNSNTNEEPFVAPLIVIGWDRRDGNSSIVNSLVNGLNESGCNTQLVGEVPTPGLHHCLLLLNADAGMMVTASHNPATDSGVKLFDKYGFKSMPELEDLISEYAWGGIKKEIKSKGQILEEYDGLRAYRKHLKEWLDVVSSTLGLEIEQLSYPVCEQGLILDCSGGAATDWLNFGLARRGLLCDEVSSRDVPINYNCGAGEFNSTDSWSYRELIELEQNHALLEEIGNKLRENDGMPPWTNGQLVAAALDGDGDRCLLIEATKDGVKIVDGDQMAFDWLNALRCSSKENLTLAHSIESDLCLPATCESIGIQTIQTAIGDRWLSAAIASKLNSEMQFISDHSMPPVCGCEDSGHLVMPTPHPHLNQKWALVGDGAATLLSQLYARAKLGNQRIELPKGWKVRKSVKETKRSLWNGKNELADEIEDIIKQTLPSAELQRKEINGETSLLLLEGTIEGESLSIGIRNSGTEAKTSLTIKSENTEFMRLEEKLCDKLRESLVLKS